MQRPMYPVRFAWRTIPETAELRELAARKKLYGKIGYWLHVLVMLLASALLLYTSLSEMVFGDADVLPALALYGVFLLLYCVVADNGIEGRPFFTMKPFFSLIWTDHVRHYGAVAPAVVVLFYAVRCLGQHLALRLVAGDVVTCGFFVYSAFMVVCHMQKGIKHLPRMCVDIVVYRKYKYSDKMFHNIIATAVWCIIAGCLCRPCIAIVYNWAYAQFFGIVKATTSYDFPAMKGLEKLKTDTESRVKNIMLQNKTRNSFPLVCTEGYNVSTDLMSVERFQSTEAASVTIALLNGRFDPWVVKPLLEIVFESTKQAHTPNTPALYYGKRFFEKKMSAKKNLATVLEFANTAKYLCNRFCEKDIFGNDDCHYEDNLAAHNDYRTSLKKECLNLLKDSTFHEWRNESKNSTPEMFLLHAIQCAPFLKDKEHFKYFHCSLLHSDFKTLYECDYVLTAITTLPDEKMFRHLQITAIRMKTQFETVLSIFETGLVQHAGVSLATLASTVGTTLASTVGTNAYLVVATLPVVTPPGGVVVSVICTNSIYLLFEIVYYNMPSLWQSPAVSGTYDAVVRDLPAISSASADSTASAQ